MSRGNRLVADEHTVAFQVAADLPNRTFEPVLSRQGDSRLDAGEHVGSGGGEISGGDDGAVAAQHQFRGERVRVREAQQVRHGT